MALITLFSTPKPFTDPDIARLQFNALRSWQQLPETEVLLLGNEDGLSAAARQLGFRHLSQVACNRNRVPLVSSMLRLARETSDSPLLAIINADIILTHSFVRAAQDMLALCSQGRLASGFVLLSRRWDLEVPEYWQFTNDWEDRLRRAVQKQGRLHRPTGSDFFLFPRDCYADIPDFAIGRAGWDNWMIYEARRHSWPVVDGTPSMMVVHQSHDYRHLPGARPHYNHPDTEVNTRLAGGQAAIRYTILDATEVLVEHRLARPALTSERFLRGLELFIRRLFFFLPENMLENIARPQRWNKRIKRIFKKPGS